MTHPSFTLDIKSVFIFMKDLFRELVDPQLYQRLVEILEDHVPTLIPGWDDEVQSRVTELLREPVILDSFAYRKVFRSNSFRRPPGGMTASPSGSVEELKGLFDHYAKGLLLMHDLAVKLGLPLSHVVKGPKAMLGYKFVNHQGFLEFGLSLTEEKPFPEYIVTACDLLFKERYSRMLSSGQFDPISLGVNLNDYLNVKASYPRGKNTGLPWIASGSDRLMNDLVLAIDAGLACALVRGYPMDVMFDGLALGYVVFSRYQRTAKSVPVQLLGQQYSSTGIEARRRIINSTPKVLALAVKPLVKWLTLAHMQMPEFNQDRKEMLSRIRKATCVDATDASRFDLRSGGVKLKQGLELMWGWAKHFFPDCPDAVGEIMMKEAFLPSMVTYDGPNGPMSYWTDKSSLRSGASTTSRVGSVINLMYDMIVVSATIDSKNPSDIVNYYIKHEPTIISGDDMLKLFESSTVRDKYLGNLPCLKDVGMTVDTERPVKFLGYLIHPEGREVYDDSGMLIDTPSQRNLFHAANPLDNMFFPERFRQYAVASMLSRYIILKNQKALDVLDTLQRVMTDSAEAMKWYKGFFEEVYPTLKEHYSDHPVGAARQYFSTLISPDELTLDKLALAIRHDEDEFLRHIAQTMRFDVNPHLFGEDGSLMDVELAELDDENYIVSSLLDLKASFASETLSKGRVGKMDSLLLSKKFINRDPRVLPLLRLFSCSSDTEFVTTWRSVLDQTSRKIDTPYGAIYAVNL